MAEPMPDTRLAEIREREAAATPGPWWSDEDDRCWRLHGVDAVLPSPSAGLPDQIVNRQILKAPKRDTPYAEYWPDEADGAFIVHSRVDVRDLLAEVDRLRDRLADLEGEHAKTIDNFDSFAESSHEDANRLRAENERLRSGIADAIGDVDVLASWHQMLRRLIGDPDARKDGAE